MAEILVRERDSGGSSKLLQVTTYTLPIRRTPPIIPPYFVRYWRLTLSRANSQGIRHHADTVWNTASIFDIC